MDHSAYPPLLNSNPRLPIPPSTSSWGLVSASAPSPSDLKRVIEKIAEFIFKNGKEFEYVLAEQDRAHGRFPFLLPSNQYHPYYIKSIKMLRSLSHWARVSSLRNMIKLVGPGTRYLLHTKKVTIF